MAHRTAAGRAADSAAAAASPVSAAPASSSSSSASSATDAAVAAGLVQARSVARADAAALRRWVIPLGVALRLLLSCLLHAQHLHSAVSSRAELTNALVSFDAVRESVSNVQVAGVSPYAGLTCSHAPPLLLAFFTAVLDVPANAAAAPTGLAMFASPAHLAMLVAWIAIDCAIALVLFALASDYYARFPSQSAALCWSQSLFQSNRVVRHLALWVAGVYLLNPITLASCVIFNLSHLTHLAVVSMLLAASRGRPVAAGSLLALCAYLDMYPLLALAPVLLLLHKGKFSGRPREFPQYDLDKYILNDRCRFIEDDRGDAEDEQGPTHASAAADAGSSDPLSDEAGARAQRDSSLTYKRVLKVVYRPVALPAGAEIEIDAQTEGAHTAPRTAPIPSDASLGVVEFPSRWNVPFLLVCVSSFLVVLSLLLYLSHLLLGSSWSYLRSTYGYSLLLPSLSPTYSLFWYFFVAMFERFHSFFLVIFHAHVLVYLLPLCVRFRDEPLFLAALVLHLLEVFRAYPTLPGLVFTATLAVLLQLPLLLLTLRRIYLVVFLNVVSILTQALMRFLWLDSGSGNANFMYFQHTLFMFSHLVCVMECLGAVRRRQAAVLEGQCQETIARRRAAARQAATTNGAQTNTNTSSSSSTSQPTEESKKHA